MVYLLLQIRAQDITTAEGTAWIYAPSITNLLKRFSTLDLPPTTYRGKKQFSAKSDQIYSILAHDWNGLSKAGNFKGSKAGEAQITLAGKIRCPHSQLRPRLHAMRIKETDMDKLLKLEEERVDLWRKFGAHAASVTVTQGELPLWDAAECKQCKEADRLETKKVKDFKLQKQADRQTFKVLEKPKLPLDRTGARTQLKVGTYHLIPADWRREWLDYVTADGEPPSHLQPSVLRCCHGQLPYQPAAYFESGDIKDRHPHELAYVLVPQKEALSIYEKYGQKEVAAGWCTLECRKHADAGTERTFVCDPPVCKICTGSDPKLVPFRIVAQIQTDMKLRCRDQKDWRRAREVQVTGNATGAEVKENLIIEFGFEDVVAGQLLLTIDGESFGDCDTIFQALGKRSFIRRISLLVEIYDFVMEPASKRRRSSLMDSNLAGNALVGSAPAIDSVFDGSVIALD